jgi:hypothetical protein
MKRRQLFLPLLITLPLLNSACRSLPPLKASEIRSSTSVLGVHVAADAVGVSVTERTIKATDVKWTVAFPGFSHVTTAKDYQQSLPKEDAK